MSPDCPGLSIKLVRADAATCQNCSLNRPNLKILSRSLSQSRCGRLPRLSQRPWREFAATSESRYFTPFWNLHFRGHHKRPYWWFECSIYARPQAEGRLIGLLHIDEICGFGPREGEMDLRLHPKLLSATTRSTLSILKLYSESFPLTVVDKPSV